jgi:PAS domain S-box-containing protein
MLASLDCGVIGPVATGEAAIAVIDANPPDLILMDIQLAGEMNGITAAQRICSTADVPLVFLTSYSQDHLIQQAKAAMPYGYLLKPVSKRELEITIEMALNRHMVDCQLKEYKEARRENEERFAQLAEQNATFAWDVDPLGLFTYVSGVSEAEVGYRPDELIGEMHFYDLHPRSGRAAFKISALAVFERKESFKDIVNPVQSKDGRQVWLSSNGIALLDVDGTLRGYRGSHTDITERKLSGVYKEMGRDVLQILNEPGDLNDSIQRILAVLKSRTGLDAVGIRLQDGNDFPYLVQEGFAEGFLQTENMLAERDADGEPCRDKAGNVKLECNCGMVISARTDHASPLFTVGGSFWTNNSSLLLNIPPGDDFRLHPRNKCIHEGYASIALVPIRNNERVVGLIQFNDRRKGQFTLDRVELLEGIASHIGAALMRKQASKTIREANEFNENLLKSIPYGIDIVDQHGTILFANENMKSHFDAEIIGTKCFVQYTDDGVQCPDCPLKQEIIPGKKSRLIVKRVLNGRFIDIIHIGITYQSKPALLEIFHDITTLKQAEEVLKLSNNDLEQRVAMRTKELLNTQEATISSMAILAEFRDNETGAHIQRTKLYVKLILEKLCINTTYSPNDIELIWHSAPLHDIGKVAISDSILFKPGKLTETEFNQMKKHCLFGYEAIRKTEVVLGENSFLNFAKEITRSHHEKWDGTGYPQGLKGEEIPLTARVMAIADVYDALVSERPYKQPFSHKKAVEIIQDGSGRHFDPILVEIFMENHADFNRIAKQYRD